MADPVLTTPLTGPVYFCAPRFGEYTDDTQMAVALTRSLVTCGRADAADCAKCYAEDFEPRRGYGGSTVKVCVCVCMCVCVCVRARARV